MNLWVDKRLIIDFHLREGIICKFRLFWKKRINDKKKSSINLYHQEIKEFHSRVRVEEI